MGGEVQLLRLLLKFATAKENIPILGLTPKISVQYHNEVLPDANSCFHVLKLPTRHENYRDFSQAMKVALRHASCSFGELWLHDTVMYWIEIIALFTFKHFGDIIYFLIKCYCLLLLHIFLVWSADVYQINFLFSLLQ